MHPSVGPWAEANLLYVDQLQLGERLQQSARGPLRIFDVGLGAGTNALAALACARGLGAQRRRELEIISFERDLAPFRLALDHGLGVSETAGLQREAHVLRNHGVYQGGGITWRLMEGEFLELLAEIREPAHLIYFDPFSPQVNPELWSVASLQQVFGVCDPEEGTTLATYSAATPTRLGLLLAGFFVGTGVAVGTKKETTVAANQLRHLKSPLGPEFIGRWERSTARAPYGAELTATDETALRAHAQFRDGSR